MPAAVTSPTGVAVSDASAIQPSTRASWVTSSWLNSASFGSAARAASSATQLRPATATR
jgi:hypothetical protein